MDIPDVVWKVGPIITIIATGGGVWAVMKWRVEKLEQVVSKMSTDCVQNRQVCHGELGNKLDKMRTDFREMFEASASDRKELRDKVHELNITIARLDQKLLNGKGHI